MAEPHTREVVIVGGGHNGLTAAAYLANAGLSVLVLERLAGVGGAAVSAVAFEGFDARISRYSYLVSLMPRQIIDELGLRIELARRRYSSYTPVPGDPAGRGLLIDHGDAEATRRSFARMGAQSDADAFAGVGEEMRRVAAAIWPTMTEPLPTRTRVRERLGDDALWSAVFERPIGEFITSRIRDDVVRGVVATDALIGTFASLDDPGLAQNRCFLYHLIGGGTGDWDVPVGGMGGITRQLAEAAQAAGADIRTGAEVTAISPSGAVTFTANGAEHVVIGDTVLAGVAPSVLAHLLGADGGEPARPEGAQVKVNLLLTRLPKLRDATLAPEAAFGGTFHINESYRQLQRAHGDAIGGAIPSPLPCEVYCHSLADPSILGRELAEAGAHTLTVFGLHVPDRLLSAANNEQQRHRLQRAVLDSLDSVLAEPIENVVMRDPVGRACIETRTTRDLEAALNMTGGNIFHGPLAWPFAEDDASLDTPARRWGVATEHDRILVCGAGTQRGGGVSGIGGHNAAMAVLEARRR